ncbi:MAG: OmpP1/FadL family transporter [Pseudobdellovibrionaceae bacterium]
MSWKSYICGVLLNLCMAPPSAPAAFDNYNSILVGDRASGMGGAGTALLKDTASSAFYNPATLSQTQGSAFAAAVGVYKKYDTTFGSEANYAKTPMRVSTGFFRSLPASTGNVLHIGDYYVGLSIVVPDYYSFKGDLRNTDTNVSSLTVVDESLWVGGAIAKSIGKDQSLGLTAYYASRNAITSIQDRSFNDANKAILFSSEKTIWQNAIVLIFGYYQKLNEQWAWGVSARPKAFAFASAASLYESRTVAVPYESSTLSRDDLTANTFIPGKLAVGVSWQAQPDLLVNADVAAYEGASFEDISLSEKAKLLDYKSIANFSVGAEYSIYEWLRLRAGVFTNLSSHPDPDVKLAKAQADHVDQAGFSANLTFLAKNRIGYTFGGYYTGGRGRSVQRINQGYEEITKNQHEFTMLVATSFYF